MTKAPGIIDLTGEPESAHGLLALDAVRDLGRGATVGLRTPGDPALLMESLNLQLRGALVWETQRHGAAWDTLVRRADDVPPRSVVELLERDHRRLDGLLATALRLLNAGDTLRARPLLETFARDLIRHADAEDDLVAGALTLQPGFEPLLAMQNEHAELRVQLAAIEQCFAEAPPGSVPDAWEIEPFVAILSGTLAKHEHREEQGLFPAWRARLAARSRSEQDFLLEAVRARLGGDPGNASASPDAG